MTDTDQILELIVNATVNVTLWTLGLIFIRSVQPGRPAAF
jgi:hypothetical protein